MKHLHRALRGLTVRSKNAALAATAKVPAWESESDRSTAMWTLAALLLANAALVVCTLLFGKYDL